MAVLFVDGCSHYATDDVLTKWAAGTSVEVEATTPRRPGSKSLQLYGVFKLRTPTFASTNYLACGFGIRHAASWTVDLIKGTQVQVRLGLTGSTLSVYRGPGTDLLASLDVSALIYTNEWYYIEFASTIHDTVGTIEVRLNGIQLGDLTLTGQDTKPSTDTGIDRVEFGGASPLWTDFYFDSTTLHGDCVVDLLYPTGAGNHADWGPSAGANWENVDDVGDIDGDATYNASATQGDKDSFTTGNLPSRPGSVIKAVALSATTRKDGAASRVLKPMLRINSTDYTHAAAGLILSDVFHGMQRLWETNPDLSAQWTESGVNGSEIGYDLVTAT